MPIAGKDTALAIPLHAADCRPYAYGYCRWQECACWCHQPYRKHQEEIAARAFWLAIETMDECARLVCLSCWKGQPFALLPQTYWPDAYSLGVKHADADTLDEFMGVHSWRCAADPIRREQLRRWKEM